MLGATLKTPWPHELFFPFHLNAHVDCCYPQFITQSSKDDCLEATPNERSLWHPKALAIPCAVFSCQSDMGHYAEWPKPFPSLSSLATVAWYSPFFCPKSSHSSSRTSKRSFFTSACLKNDVLSLVCNVAFARYKSQIVSGTTSNLFCSSARELSATSVFCRLKSKSIYKRAHSRSLQNTASALVTTILLTSHQLYSAVPPLLPAVDNTSGLFQLN